MNEQGLGGAADAHATHFRVDHDPDRLVQIGCPVDVDMHDALEMGEDGHPRLALHPLNEALAAARDDHVERSAEAFEHFADRRTRGERRARNGRLGKPGLPEAGSQAGVDRGRGMEAVRPAAQHDSVAALETKSARVGRHVRSALVDDADDAERRRHALDDEAVGASEGRQHAADRVRQRRHLLQAARDRFDAGVVQREPVKKGARQTLRLADVQIPRVGGKDIG